MPSIADFMQTSMNAHCNWTPAPRMRNVSTNSVATRAAVELDTPMRGVSALAWVGIRGRCAYRVDGP